MTPKPTIEMSLTPEQKAQIQEATGKRAFTLKLEPLEERIAPVIDEFMKIRP